MFDFKIEHDGRLHVEDDHAEIEHTPLGYYPAIIEAANALSELRKTFDKMQAQPNDVTRYHEGIYPHAIVLEIDGEPMGVVRIIDDIYRYVPFKSSEVK